MPQIVIAGAPTGCWTNLGDEAILAGMAATLRAAVPGLDIVVVSSSPEGFFDAHGCDAVRYDDLDSDRWREQNQRLLTLDAFDAGYRLVTARTV